MTRFTTGGALALALTLAVAAGCARGEAPPRKEDAPVNQPAPCDFDAIQPGSMSINPCTPEVADDFRGIQINAPAEVLFGPGTEERMFGGFTKLIVAGFCQLEYPTLGLRGRWNDAIVLVATDAATREVWSGRLARFGTRAPPRDPLKDSPVKPEDYSGAVMGTPFNPNIVNDLALPAREADYDVYATLGPYRSNVVHVKVRKKK